MTEEAKVKTQDELLADMRVALDKGDYKAVSKVSSEIAKLESAREKVEKEAKSALLVTTTESVKKALDKALKAILDGIDPGVLKAMDGVWYSYDFGEKLIGCKLVKGAVRKAGGGGGGGGGKKFSITTTELLGQYGDNLMGDSGKTFNEAWAESTDGNRRYNIRMKLLKLANIS